MVNKAPSASLFSSILLLILAFLVAMANSAPKSVASSSESAVHIVYTERPLENEEPEAYHIRTLASVLGSEEAAKGALIYSYKTAASGFSAKLTPQQVEEISISNRRSSWRMSGSLGRCQMDDYAYMIIPSRAKMAFRGRLWVNQHKEGRAQKKLCSRRPIVEVQEAMMKSGRAEEQIERVLGSRT
ncbi:Proteinase inhibitor, propeptide [Prunus dulcis]|uniref:Proteinase inhibitor, propeptide n=1 Tax=Prunus dulcis TaxID=3755 RepID=A0A4Y1RXN2_PRUDU|nr:Proteinase inhibitor, propeptide [Prunus dulcis]